MRTAFLATIATALLGSSAGAQEDQEKPKKAPPTRAQKLMAACEAMTRLPSLAFDTKQQTTNRATGLVMRGMAKPKERTFLSSGKWTGDLLELNIGEEDRVVFRGCRMIAADDDHDWSMRRGKLADGSALPFALDPSVLFTNLAEMKPKVVHHAVGSIGGKPVEIHTIRLDADEARTLLWSGCIPDDSGQGTKIGVGGGGAVFLRAIGAAGGGRKPDVFVDLSIAFDPATKLIHRIQGKSYTKSNAVGGRIVMVGGPGGGLRRADEDEEEEEEEDEGGYDDDELPVHPRKLEKTTTIVKFTLNFYDHGKAKAPKLSRRARRLLGFPS